MLPLAARAPFALLAALLLVRFADEWLSFLPAGALEAIRADLGLSYAEAGLILVALPAGGLVGHGFWVAADHLDRRLLAGGGALVYGLCALAFAAGHGLIFLLLAGFVWGAASDAFLAASEITLIRLYPDALAPVLGRVNAYGAIGDLLGPLTLAGAAALGVGWRAVFALVGGLMLLYALALARQAFPAPGQRAAAPSVPALASLVRSRQLVQLALVNGLFALLDEPFQGFTIASLERAHGLSPTAATSIIAGWVIAGAIGFIAVPTFTARLPPRTLLLAFGGSNALAVALLVFGPLVPLQALAALAFGFGGAVFYAVLQATYLGLRPERAGTVRAVVSTIGTFGIAFPALVGLVADAYGLSAGLGLYAAIGPLILALLIVR